MPDPFAGKRRAKWGQRLLALDSWADSSLHDVGRGAGDFYERVCEFFRRFKARGIGRIASELVSEGAALGIAGALLLLAFAVPAFDAIKEDWLKETDFSVTFLDRYGNAIGRRGVLQDDTIELEDLPDDLVKAVLATEDRRFFDHFGIDVLGTFRAIGENMRAGGVVQGGSSITQQVAKNLFLSNERTLERKIKEAYLALWLETNLSKHDILKLYLNRAYLGGGTFGVGAASEFYFGKKVQDLNLAEAAMIAGLFKAPAGFAPHLDLPAARARANEVLTNLVQAGFMAEGQVAKARLHPAVAVQRSQAASADYFLDWAFQQVKEHISGRHRVLIARTTLDLRLQRAAEAAVESTLRESGKAYRVGQAALVSMDRDGAVRAMVGGRDYGESAFNRAVNALRQPGSSFKAYVYATALETGRYTPETTVLDAPVKIGDWSPKNSGGSYWGRMSMRTALAQSVNTVAVRLSIATGRQPIAELAERMGVKTPLKVVRSLPLGSSELTVLDQATGFSTIANGGFGVDARALLDVRTPSDEIVYDGAAQVPRERVLRETTATSMVDMLKGVVRYGTGKRAQLPGHAVAGKTGTTNGYKDAWFVGFTENHTAAVWFGNDNYASTRKLAGGLLPAETWRKYMRVATAREDVKPSPGRKPPAGDRDAQIATAGRLGPETSALLGQMEERFRSAMALPVRQAVLNRDGAVEGR